MQKNTNPSSKNNNKILHPKYKRRRAILLIVGAVALFCFFYVLSQFIEYNSGPKSIEALGESGVEETLDVADSAPQQLPDKPVTTESVQDTFVKNIANSNWQTVIVNKKYPLETDFIVELEPVSMGMSLDSRIATDFKLMMIKAKSEGINLELFHGYLTPNEQEDIYNLALNKLLENSDNSDAAKNYLSSRVPEAWTSENHTGLAVDISTPDLGIDNRFGRTPEYQWLMKNAADYGFALRYPKDKLAVTGYEYDPCHFRYVGKEIAQYLMTYNFTLEEYIYLQEQKLNDKIITAVPEDQDTENPEGDTEDSAVLKETPEESTELGIEE